MILTGTAPSMTFRWEPFADEVSLFALGPLPALEKFSLRRNVWTADRIADATALEFPPVLA